jgi:hypothetical protein
MTAVTPQKWLPDPRSDEVHLPSDEALVMSVMRNLVRTLLRARWQPGHECSVPRGGSRRQSRLFAMSGLNTGLFVGRDHKTHRRPTGCPRKRAHTGQ